MASFWGSIANFETQPHYIVGYTSKSHSIQFNSIHRYPNSYIIYTHRYPNIPPTHSSCLELSHSVAGHAAPCVSTHCASHRRGRDDGGVADPTGSGGFQVESDEVRMGEIIVVWESPKRVEK